MSIIFIRYADISSLEDINIVNSNQDNEAKFTYEIETDNVTAPLSKGSVVGKITVYKDGKYFNSMFFECKKFEGNGLENWVVGKVKDMSNMFYGCIALENKPSWYKE